jgi:hypothetical protein
MQKKEKKKMNSIFRQELEKLRFEIRAFKTFEEKLEK